MKNENSIEVKYVKKKFKVYLDKGRSLKEKVLFQNRNRYETRYVLNGVNFEVKKGEAIGLIGQNGCGKSTTLKLLTKIMYPDEGTIEINGRVSSLIELGAGFHPDMSGRENIYTNASIFGLTRKEIDERMKDIVDFSELGKYLDNPVRTYSSGMYMRLAFSVAINVDADVLLIDEILAVGDVNFQAKCFNKLREIKAKGTTIVIVSHSLGQIEQICDKTIWIDNGIVREIGKPREVHPVYMEFMGEKNHLLPETLPDNNSSDDPLKSSDIPDKKRWGNKDVEIINYQLCNHAGVEKDVYRTGEEMVIKLNYLKHREVSQPVIGIGIFRNDGVHCYGTNTMVDGNEKVKLNNSGIIEFVINKNNLLEGEYSLDIAIHSEDGFAYDFIKEAKSFRVYSVLSDIGITRLDHEWIIN